MRNKVTKIGSILRKRRKARSITQDKLAELLDVSRGIVYSWEHDVHWPGGLVLLKIMTILGLKLEDFPVDIQQHSGPVVENLEFDFSSSE